MLVRLALVLVLALGSGCGHGASAPPLGTRVEHHGALHGAVRVVELGPADAPPVVLVHGLSAEGLDDFAAVLPALAQQYRVVAFDLPGFGSSQTPGRVHTPSDYVALIERIVAERFPGKVALVGHSMGGALALAYAAEHPERVGHLALYDVAGVLYFRDYTRRVVAGHLRDRGNALDAFRRLASALFRVSTKPFSHKELHELPFADGPRVAFASFDFGPALRKVSAPVMLGWGKEDLLAPARTRELLRYWLAPVREVEYPGSGHVPMRTEPDAVARDLRAFFAEDVVRREPRGLPDPSTLPSHHCRGQRGLQLRGDYADIVLEDCRDVRLEHVRARSLVVRSSNVELVGVELRHQGIALEARRARITWVGGRIASDVCIDTRASRIELVGVHCHFDVRSLQVHEKSHLRASASAFEGLVGRRDLHGEYPLTPNVPERGAR